MSLAGTLNDLEAANKGLNERVAELEAAGKQAAELNGQLEAAGKARAELEARTKALEGDLAKAQKALANPAFLDALASGRKTPPNDGGEAPTAETDEAFLAAYRAEPNGEKRAAMWRKRQEG